MTDRSELEALAEKLDETLGGSGADNAVLASAARSLRDIARRLQPARVPVGYSLVPTFLAGQLHPGRWQEVWIGTKKRKLTITLDDAYWADVMSRLAAAPAAEGEKCADCCDTPAYCSSVQRCTDQDESRAATPAPESREATKCERCGADTGVSCDDRGCGYLNAGNGEPEAGQREGVESEIARLIQDATGCADSDSVYAAMAVMKRLASAQHAGTGSQSWRPSREQITAACEAYASGGQDFRTSIERALIAAQRTGSRGEGGDA